jgi:D-beta-D-heptose 7-phosphate kinase/D-beta-D-heptose 1-phosphate adenosyltransferase
MIDLIDAISEKLNNCQTSPIICIGDIMLDRFYYGVVERISPEAPVPVLFIEEEKYMLGGAGNVVANICDLNSPVTFFSVVGDDIEAQIIDELLKKNQKCKAFLIKDSSRKTTVKTRCVGGSQQIVRIDKENKHAISHDICELLLSKLREELKKDSILILSDYGKGVLSEQLVSEIIVIANAVGAKVIIDPKGFDYSKYQGAYLITPNRRELGEAVGKPVKDDLSVVNAACSLIDKFNIQNILATRSEDGMSLVTQAGETTHIRTEAKEIFDVSGAGDTVIATVAVGLACDLQLNDAAFLANKAAALVIRKIGTATIDIDELSNSLLHDETTHAERKIHAHSTLEQLVLGWKKNNLKVGFTNGCFDLLHQGHAILLEKCKRQVDRLIVGINSDGSVQRLKGKDRPVQGEISRALVLASLQSVDAVVLFSEDTPIKLIELTKPDKLFKGGDYSPDTVVGAEFVNNNGGEVVIIDLVADQSTTRLINKMRSQA